MIAEGPQPEATRSFDLGDVLSITTGRLVSRRHIDGVYDILNWMTGDNLYTHQLPRASEECAPALVMQHPQLAALFVPELSTEEGVNAWLDSLVPVFGASLEVAPLAPEDHTHVEPVDELLMRGVPPERIIAIEHDV